MTKRVVFRWSKKLKLPWSCVWASFLRGGRHCHQHQQDHHLEVVFEQACFSLVREGRQEHEQDSAWWDHWSMLDLAQPCWIIIHCGENVWKFHEIPGTGVWVKSKMSDHIHTWVVIFNIFCCCCCRCHRHCWKHPQNLWDGLDAPSLQQIIVQRNHCILYRIYWQGALKMETQTQTNFWTPCQ